MYPSYSTQWTAAQDYNWIKPKCQVQLTSVPTTSLKSAVFLFIFTAMMADVDGTAKMMQILLSFLLMKIGHITMWKNHQYWRLRWVMGNSQRVLCVFEMKLSLTYLVHYFIIHYYTLKMCWDFAVFLFCLEQWHSPRYWTCFYFLT